LHLLSQPIAALQCSLELALMQQSNSPETKDLLEHALENAERLLRLLRLLRELSQADDSGEPNGPLYLESWLAEALEPFFEQLRIPHLPGVMIMGRRQRLLAAIWHVFECLPNDPGALGAEVHLAAAENGGQAILRLWSSAAPAAQAEILSGVQELALEVARRTFAASGGQLCRLSSAEGRRIYQIVLPTLSVTLPDYVEGQSISAANENKSGF
jgi:hypothetical protein